MRNTYPKLTIRHMNMTFFYLDNFWLYQINLLSLPEGEIAYQVENLDLTQSLYFETGIRRIRGEPYNIRGTGE